MTQKVSSDPYERMGNLAPQVRYKTLNHKKLEVFFSNAQEKSYNELFQALLDSLKVAMEETFSQDPVVKGSESKLIKNQETIHSMAEHHSSCYKSLQYIEDRLKEFGYQPPPSTTNHEWCVLS